VEDFEGPDFLVHAEHDKTVGIEIVDYVRGQGVQGSVHRRDEELHQQVADEAKSRFEEEASVTLEAHFIWHPGRHLKKSLVTPLACQAVEVVKDHMPIDLLQTVIIHSDQFSKPLRRYLHSLFLVRLSGAKPTIWSSGEGDFIGVSAEEVQSVVDLKNEKAEDYRQHCDRIWLLIVADGSYVSSMVELLPEVRAHSFEADFDKVIFWDRLQRRSVGLCIEAGALTRR
jgi:hypothetical protein